MLTSKESKGIYCFMYILGKATRVLKCNMKCIHFRSQQVCGFSGYVILCSESTSGHSRSAAFLANFIHNLSAQTLGVNDRTIPQFLVQQMFPRSCLLHSQSTYSAVISCQMANLQVNLKPWVYNGLVCV
jgi:hypothetical protein